MSNRNKKPSVDKNIPSRTFDFADWCARELWRSRKYHKNKPTVSDDELMGLLSKPVHRYLKNNLSSVKIKETDVKTLIQSAQLGRWVKGRNLKIKSGVRNLGQQIDLYGWLWQTLIHSDQDFFEIPTCFVYEVGKDFYKGQVQRTVDGCHAALASRLLFFAVPEIPIFNFSSNLAKQLGFRDVRPAEVLGDYYEIVGNAYCKYWKTLKKYQMPLSDYLADDFWLSVRRSGWWQRRVFDIALLLHYRIFDKKYFIKEILAKTHRKYV